MSRVFIAPSRYVQGAGAIAEIGTRAARMGTKALFAEGKTALNVCGSLVVASLKDNKVGCHTDAFKGECSDKEIGRLMSVARANGADLVIAAGGGKAIDTGKVMGHEMKIPVIVAPPLPPPTPRVRLCRSSVRRTVFSNVTWFCREIRTASWLIRFWWPMLP